MTAAPLAVTVAPARPADRAAVGRIAQRTGVFSAEEVQTALELFDGYLADAQRSGYNFLGCYAASDGRLLGFACWGPTSLSKGAADLYWLATDPDAQGQGVGTALFRAVEAAVRAAGRWLIMIWTSSSPLYAPARALYQRLGCALAMQLTDFYDRGDDLCAYVRRL
ncbi:MAG: GNAT family N-acetyltransferase [Anaerolineales bacterium]|nr:GNAT family N-acetyltransferase [Anaerolineales bacterium]